MSVTYGSLFAGYGGLDMGVQSVIPGELSWWSDIDPGAVRIMAWHHPDAPNLGDITAVDWSTVPRVDVLTGGFPCQDISAAGRRAGLIRNGDDRTRSGLWGEMRHAINALRPALVVAENVRSLTSARADSDVEPCPWCLGDGRAQPHLRALGAVLGDLADIGYDALWRVVSAADVGAPHLRERAFIVAWPRGAAADTLRITQRQHPRAALSEQGRRLRQCDQSGGDGAGRDAALLATPQARDAKGVPGGAYNTRSLPRDVALLPTPRATSGGSSTETAALLLPTPRASDGKHGGPNQRGSSGDLALPSAVLRWGKYAGAVARWETITGRTHPEPTEPNTLGNPALTAAFVEWMMGLPPGHVTHTDMWHGYTPSAARAAQLHALGNGVMPAQAELAIRLALTDITHILDGAA